jgi:hypothetical protein
MSTPVGERELLAHGVGAGVEATKRLHHLLELRGGAELEDGQTNIDLFCPVFTAKDMEDRQGNWANLAPGARPSYQEVDF